MNSVKKTPSGSCPVEDGEECAMPQRRKWGIDRGINPVYIGILATLILGLLAWGGGPGGVNSHFSAIDTTLAQHEKEDKTLHDAQEKLERKTEDRLKSIDEKLDRLIERRK